MVAAALGVLALLLAFLIVHDVLFPPAPTLTSQRSVPVSVGSVRSAVSGTGTVVPVTQQNMSFNQSGQLSEIDVKVGDHVTAGQTLAKLDPTVLQQALDQANNNLTQAQASLNSTLNGNAVQQAQHNLANAQQSLTDAQAQVNLTNQQDANTVANDQSQLSNDQTALSTANTNRDNIQRQIDNVDTPAVQQAQKAYDDCIKANQTPAACTQQAGNLQSAQNVLAADTQARTSAQQAASQAQTAVNSDQSRQTTDQNKQASDQVSNQKTIDTANAAVITAQDSLNSQTIQRPSTIASQQATVANDQLAVQTAQRNLSQTTLTAPFDSTVLSINGQVGETVSGGAGTTAQAPGTTAPQPSSSGATSSSAGGSAGSSGGGGASGGFMVLGNVSGLEVVAPFAEADAARLAANQQATITFDAVANLTLPAHVLAVASGATVISNVANYYATLVIDRLDQRLKSGMTANANVIVQQVAGVLTLPNSAITRLGTSSFVTLLDKNGTTTRQPVQTGTVGDSTTEIVSGLNPGDRVVLPQLRTSTGGAAGGRGAGGGFGGGGGAIRVGGGG
jgi:multidrug efflux pump subunit AcrA (membrane-fusion protein)